jgi:hypothetical protein
MSTSGVSVLSNLKSLAEEKLSDTQKMNYGIE